MALFVSFDGAGVTGVSSSPVSVSTLCVFRCGEDFQDYDGDMVIKPALYNVSQPTGTGESNLAR